jgi:hypothetical protein
MRDDQTPAPESSGGMTMWHLLLAMCFVVPIAIVFDELKSTGAGLILYLLCLPLSVVLACGLVVLNWKSMKLIRQLADGCSDRMWILVGVAMLAVEFAWMILGGIAGYALCRALIRLVTH